MVFYKGGLQHRDKYITPIPEIINLKDSAETINREIIREQNKASQGKRWAIMT